MAPLGGTLAAALAVALALATAAGSAPCPALAPRAANLDLECALPGGTDVELSTRAGDYAALLCGEGGRYRCAELPRVPASPAPPPRVGLRGCALPANESLACTLAALGAPAATALKLQDVPGGAAAGLRPEHVRGLPALAALTLVGADPDAGAAPLPAAALAELPALRRLTVREARLRLSPDALAGARALEYLELSASELRELGGALRGLAALRTLALWRNELTTLPAGALRGLAALELLELSSNPLGTLEAGALADAPRLRELRLMDTALAALEQPALRGLARLETLLVQSARAPLAVGAGALALPALRVLLLESCGLAALPADALWGARALRTLSLADNTLAALPGALLRDAGELRALNLSGNALARLEPALFAPLLRLEDLNLDRNRLEAFQEDLFATLGSLRSLSARGNRLRALAPSALSGAHALARLDLADNELALCSPEGDEGGEGDAYAAEFGPSSPLHSLLALRRLDVSGNRLGGVCSDWRYVMLQLEMLNLTRNLLHTITEADINFLSRDVTVDFRYNNITTVELYERSQLAGTDAPGDGAAPAEGAGGARVLLDGIPLRCDCRALGLQRRLAEPRARPRLELGAAACAAPPALAGAGLRAVPPASLACPLPAPACPAACQCTLRPAASALELDCAEPPAAADAPQPAAYGLERTVLRLRRAPASLELPLPVHELVLSGLGLTAPPPGPAPRGLELLDLSDNALGAVPELAGPTLRLAGNPLACDCAHAAALAALQREPGRVADWRRVECARGGPLWRVDAARLCAGAAAARAAWAGGALALLGLLAGAGAALGLRYRRELRVWLYARGWCGCLTRVGAEPAARYDVFVSFSHADEALVVRELVPALERRGYLVCVHYRDWAPGAAIAEHVARSVREARRTLVLVSAGFVRSEWARAEFRAAHARALREGRARVLVVLLDEPALPRLLLAPDDELAAYLRTNTYLRWGDAWFWQKLQYALPHEPLGAGKPREEPKGVLSAGGLRAALAAATPGKLAPAMEPRLRPPPGDPAPAP